MRSPDHERQDVDPNVPPSGTGCEECLQNRTWWVHLRRCAQCGHIGCCDSSPNQHASNHFHATGHPVIQSFEPGEGWFYDYRTGQLFTGPALCPPREHPLNHPVPGPAGAVPANWRDLVR